MPLEPITIDKNRRGCDIFRLRFSPTIPSNSISPRRLHDGRKIKGHWSLKHVLQVGGWFNFFLAIYDVILRKEAHCNVN